MTDKIVFQNIHVRVTCLQMVKYMLYRDTKKITINAFKLKMVYVLTRASCQFKTYKHTHDHPVTFSFQKRYACMGNLKKKEILHKFTICITYSCLLCAICPRTRNLELRQSGDVNIQFHPPLAVEVCSDQSANSRPASLSPYCNIQT